MIFLSVFGNILHVAEAAAAISAPFIAIADPEIGALMTFGNNAAIGAEAAITARGSGAQKAALVAQQTGAAINFANALRVSRGAPPLPANVVDQLTAQVQVTVAGLNAIAAAVPETPVNSAT